ncbi:unnamed protein product, partial [Sphacelaria rigidula]
MCELTSKLYAVASVPGFCRKYKKCPSLFEKSDSWSGLNFNESRNVSSTTRPGTLFSRRPRTPAAGGTTATALDLARSGDKCGLRVESFSPPGLAFALRVVIEAPPPP